MGVGFNNKKRSLPLLAVSINLLCREEAEGSTNKQNKKRSLPLLAVSIIIFNIRQFPRFVRFLTTVSR